MNAAILNIALGSQRPILVRIYIGKLPIYHSRTLGVPTGVWLTVGTSRVICTLSMPGDNVIVKRSNYRGVIV